MPFPQVSPKHDLARCYETTITCVRGKLAMASAMFLKDGTTLRSSAIRELSFEKHADTPERAEAPSRSLELRVTNPRRKDDCGGQPAIEAQTLLPRDLILALQGALRPSAAHETRLASEACAAAGRVLGQCRLRLEVASELAKGDSSA